MIKYWISYMAMLGGFGYLTLSSPNMKDKIIGILCFLLNAVLFWR
jgi:hypothetical protein